MRSMMAVLISLAFAAPGLAKGGGHSSSSHHSSSKKGGDDSKPVHVKEYTKKDGTVVEAHDRNAPSSTAATETASTKTAAPKRCETCPRDKNGKILRDPAQRAAFERQTGYPHGRKGYVVDHVVPLECGGADAPGNMQWQTAAEAKAKDATEGGCRR